MSTYIVYLYYFWSHGSISTPRSQSFSCKSSSSRVRHCSPYLKMARNSGTMDLDYCLLGVDTFMQEEEEIFRLGFVLKILWGTEISLDGDGGFGWELSFLFIFVSLAHFVAMLASSKSFLFVLIGTKCRLKTKISVYLILREKLWTRFTRLWIRC